MASDASRPQAGHGQPRPWHAPTSGTTLLAGVLMVFGGAMAFLEGIAAVASDDLFVVTRHYVFEFSLTGWGWVHLILGIALVVAGCAVLGGALWGRYFGIMVSRPGSDRQLPLDPVLPLVGAGAGRRQPLHRLGAVHGRAPGIGQDLNRRTRLHRVAVADPVISAG